MKCAKVLLSLSLASAAASVQARTPECYSGSGAAGYNSGYAAESSVISHLWNNVHQGDCFRLEDFVEAVQVPLASSATGLYLRCRDQGLIEGLLDQTDNITNQCVGESLDNGTEVGTLQGRVYCNVAVQQGYGKAAPLPPLASIVAEQSCKVAFRSYVNQNCPAEAQADPGFNQLVLDACRFQ